LLVQEVDAWINFHSGQRVLGIPPLQKPVLVAGIARPERFLAMIEKQGLHPFKCKFFEDHHRYSSAEFEQFFRDGADGLLTTEKDACRFHTLNLADRRNIWYLTIKLVFDGREEAASFFNLLHR
jgi:tetraacyldisaccharide-1-P 4'-kinase